MQIDIEQELLEAISHPLNTESCFLCATPLDQTSRSREDVIPLWLQRDLELRDEELTLMNRTSIPYRQLKIPCCADCNTKHLSRIERTISSAFREGVESVRQLSEPLIYQWLAKLYLGLLYRELTLPFDRAQPKRGYIASRSDFDNVRILWFWLRQDMTRMRSGSPPGSVWIFRCLVPPTGRGERFDLHTFHSPPTLGIRINDVGIVVDFLDCGLLRQELRSIETELQRLQMAPWQFVESFVRISYRAHLFGLHIAVSMTSSPDGERHLVFTPQSKVFGDLTFEPWNESRYASFLADRMGLGVEEIMLSDGRARSWIYGEGQNVLQYHYTDNG